MQSAFHVPGRNAAGATLSVALAIALATIAARAAATEPTVEISRFEFRPRELTIAPGTAVSWINRDQTVHNVVSAGGRIASPGLDTEDRYRVVFDQPGDYPYYCALHPQMTGVVHVRAR